MGYGRSPQSVQNQMPIFKAILADPLRPHEFEFQTWEEAQKFRQRLWSAFHAAKFHPQYRHIAALKQQVKIKIEGNAVRIIPNFNIGMDNYHRPIPLWAEKGTVQGRISNPTAKSIIEVYSCMSELTENIPWTEIDFPLVRFDKLTLEQQTNLHNKLLEVSWGVVDLEEKGMSITKRREGLPESLFWEPPPVELDIE